MLIAINSCLKNLKNSYMLSFREVREETEKLENLLHDFKKNNIQDKLNKSEILSIANMIQELSIKNDYKLSLIKDFPEYFSKISLKK